MSIRHTCNQTIKSVKRSRTSSMNEVVAVTPTVISVENNTNIVGADVTVGNAISYRGYEHIPCGTAQYNANAV